MYIFGYSGHAYVVIESALQTGLTIAGYFDYEPAITNPYALDYMGFEQIITIQSIVQNHFVFPALGDNIIRQGLIQRFEADKLAQCILIDPSARVSPTATMGLSTYVGKNACINALCQIGEGVIVNTSAIVEHECRIGDFSHIAPNATLCGNVTVGKMTFIGAGAIVKQGVRIGDNCTIGAGAIVLKDVAAGETWVGNPAKNINHVG